MHLRSITMRGFKSFPDSTRLDFAPGVSVIVGPNGSGKSNVTDAVLWALGEQSPLAVRGQTMQDVIFSGGPGVPSRSAAEVEVVIDDSERELGAGFSELSIARRLDRAGAGEYRLNGARCRLVDVLEALSETGLGKEMHSVVSQGRVEAVIHSSPRDRRLLIEEAAGLGKHRKRRRRAELKLARTEDNLSRALDVEREARSRLRPLKRQAEAADLHERLERQSLEARLALARDDARAADELSAAAGADAADARARREAAERRLAAVRTRREAAERAFEEHGHARETLSARAFAATTAADRVEMRLDRVREVAEGAARAERRLEAELRRLEDVDPAHGAGDAGEHGPDRSPHERIARLEGELAALAAASGEAPDAELDRLRKEREEAERGRARLEDELSERRAALAEAESRMGPVTEARRAADTDLDAARTESGRAHAELEAVEQLARTAAPAPGDAGALAEHLRVEPGYELALAAALGPLVRAGLAAGISEGAAALDAGAGRAASVLVEPSAEAPAAAPPAAGAEPLLERVEAGPRAAAAVARLLARVWVVDSLDALGDDFRGAAVTRAGRAFVAATGELRQAVAGADERLLERLSRRDELASAAEEAARRAAEAEACADERRRALATAAEARDHAAERARAAVRALEAADQTVRAAERAVARREEARGRSAAIRRAEIAAELRAERRMAERVERERSGRRRRAERARAALAEQLSVRRAAEGVQPSLEAALDAVSDRREVLARELRADEAAGARAAEELRSCAHQEADVQNELRDAADRVTEAEVRAQRARDAAADAERELAEVWERLGFDAAGEAPPSRPLSDEERTELTARVERLARRRERIGPVNPLAKEEYEEAVTRVEELEEQRGDLETALLELQGVIEETDRRIRESFERTFEATAHNFEEVVEELFPGGRGRLRLVTPEGPQPVLGAEGEAAADAPRAPTADDDSAATQVESREPGVEVEVTPAGKSTRRLSLMSGGERSLVALAFLFAVFLARPCPFYVLDEVEAALDDLNIDRFLRLVRRCAERAQFIVVTHQKRTMDAADRLYGVSMGSDGVSKVVSRRLSRTPAEALDRGGAAEAAA